MWCIILRRLVRKGTYTNIHTYAFLGVLSQTRYILAGSSMFRELRKLKQFIVDRKMSFLDEPYRKST